MSTSQLGASVVARRATAAFVLVTALFAFGSGLLVLIGATQHLIDGVSLAFTMSAVPYLMIALPLMSIAVVVRWRVVGIRPKQH